MTLEETSLGWALAMWDQSAIGQIKSKDMSLLQQKAVFALHTDICLTNKAYNRSRALVEILTGREE